MAANRIHSLFYADAACSDWAILCHEQLNFEMIIGQVRGDSHLHSMRFTIYYQVSVLAVLHGLVGHLNQPQFLNSSRKIHSP